MARKFLPALFLAAHGAAALEANLHPQALAAVLAAATTTNPGLLACATAEGLIDGCYSAGIITSTVPFQTQAACLCCYQGTYVAPQYLSCESYIAASMRTETDAYTRKQYPLRLHFQQPANLPQLPLSDTESALRPATYAAGEW